MVGICGGAARRPRKVASLGNRLAATGLFLAFRHVVVLVEHAGGIWSPVASIKHERNREREGPPEA